MIQSSQRKHLHINKLQAVREVTNLLYSTTLTGIVATLIAITVVTFLLATEVPYEPKALLWSIMVVVLIGRTIDFTYWNLNLKDREYPATSAYYRYVTGVVLSALAWAIFVIGLYDYFNEFTLSATMIVTCALCGGATSLMAPSRQLAPVYCGILLLPFSFVAINDHRIAFVSVGIMGVIYWVAIIRMSVKSHNFIMDALELKLSNQALLAQVSEERVEIQRVNDELHRSNEALDYANASLELEVSKRTDDIHRLSYRDAMTGLMNRKGFLRFLDKQVNTSTRTSNKFAVLFIDLDGFKQINDSLGHQVGDGVLAEIGARLRRYSEVDHLGRWGGDEFVMIVPYANEDTAVAVANATLSSISQPMDIDSYNVSLDATIGISLFPEHSVDSQELIQLADLTMHEQKKRKPGGCAVFEHAYYETLQEELTLHDGLRHAIERSELTLNYQPIVCATGKAVWAVEALLRWQFEGRFVSPAAFIPLAEKAGLINDIGSWVLHRACIDAAQWAQEDLAVSVNVSVIQLMDDGFIAALDNVLASSGLKPERLHIEITESVFADDPDKVTEQVNAVKKRNVQISIDDFGTGFSSLSQLQSLRFDHIKIDRVFVQKLEEGSDTIVRATMLIAQEFGCETVAEGIETVEDAKRLAAMGVDCFQGYLFAKPMPNQELTVWLKDYLSDQ